MFKKLLSSKKQFHISLIALALTVIAVIAMVVVKTSSQFTSVIDREMKMELTYNQLDENSGKVDNCDYVQFSAYFLRDLNGDGYAEKLDGACNNIKTKDTLYVEVDVLAQGYLENGKITLSNGNYTWTTSVVEDSVVKGNYIGKTSEITLQEKVVNGTQKIIWGETESKVSSNITDYSKVNTVTLTGTHVIEDETTGERTETEINKVVNIKVDWYGETKTFLTAPSITKDPDTLVNGENVVVDFDFTINETKKELIMQKQVAEIEIPKLNGYEATSVEVKNTGVEYEYNNETKILTIVKASKENDNGYITTISRQNKYSVRIVYPIEAYTETTEELITVDIPIKAYNYGYNNSSRTDDEDVFENPYKSSDSKTLRIIYAKTDIDGEVWNVYPYIGDYIYNKQYEVHRYEISKKYPMDIYNGNEYADNSDTYTVKWRVDIAKHSAVEKITLNEKKEQGIIKSDEILDLNKVPTNMHDYVTTKGVYFSGASTLLGADGWIKLYDAETEALIETFTKENWSTYSVETPYVVNLKSIRIETSKPISETSFCVYQIKQIDDIKLTTDINEEQFLRNDLFNTYLEAKITAPEGVLYEGESSEATINKTTYAYYDIPFSVHKVKLTPAKITNQETVNMLFDVLATKENFIESDWKNAVFLIELPNDIIRCNLNGVTVVDGNVEIKNAFAYKENDKYYIKIHTANEEATTYTLRVDADIDGNPVLATKTSSINVYAYNEECDNYSKKTADIYGVDGDGSTADMIGLASEKLLITNVGSAGLITTEFVTNYDDNGSMTIAPNIADIEKTTNDKTATINVSVTNNYTGTISELDILGKLPYEGNKYTITGGDLGSTYTANITGPMNIPDNIKNYVTVYYSEKEETNKNLSDASNEWKEETEVTDWSKIRTYLIDMGNYVLDRNENQTFTYDIVVPGGLGYNSASFTHHAVYYYLDTENGKLAIQTEPNKVGVQVVGKYDMQITKTKVGDSTVVIPNATYKVETTDIDGNILTTIGTTNSEGILLFKNLYIDREYTLKEVSVNDEYELSDEAIKFVADINDDGVLVINTNSQAQFIEIPETIVKPNGDYLIKAKLEDEVKYKLQVNKRDESNHPIANVRFTLKTNGTTKAYRTDNNGQFSVSGLHLGETYELREISAEGYYVLAETQIFKVVRNDAGVLEVQTENSDSIFNTNISNETLIANVINVKIPTYNLQILKVEEKYGEENIENLIPLAGANFLVTSYDNGNQEQYITDSNGIAEVNGLYAHVEGKYITGKYFIKEVKAPTGYSNNSEEIELVVTQNFDTVSGLPITTFSASVNNEENLTTFKKVIVEENVIKLVVEDKPLFKLTKVDSETGEPLANAEFVIYEVDKNENEIGFAKDVNGNNLGTLNADGLYTVTTDENGIIVLPLKGGIYKIVEITYPEGYLQRSNEQYFKVADGTENETILDEPEEDTIDESQYTVVEVNYIEDLVQLSQDVNGLQTRSGYLYKLMRDLDFESADSYRSGIVNNSLTKNGSGFTPIGSYSSGGGRAFSGVFDGKEHTLSNLYINVTGYPTYSTGLFGYLKNATIMNLTIDGTIKCTYPSATHTGGIAGAAYPANIINCHNKANIIDSAYGHRQVGGIVGYFVGSTSKVINCSNEGNISIKTTSSNGIACAGGIVGESDGTIIIENCYNTGIITAKGGYPDAAGIISYASGNGSKIENCYNTGKIWGEMTNQYEYNDVKVGGIVATWCSQGNSYIKNSYNLGDVYAINTTKDTSNSLQAGGLVGTSEASSLSRIERCYNKGNIYSYNASTGYNPYTYTGGILGYAKYNGTDIENCYNTGKIESQSATYNYAGGIVGYESGNVNSCYNTGDISNVTDLQNSTTAKKECYAGGVVGFLNSGSIIDTYNEGNLTSDSIKDTFVGGVVAYANSKTIKNSYNSGDLSSKGVTHSYVGGIVGNSASNTLENVYYPDYIGIEGDSINTNGESTDEYMKSEEMYNTINTNEVWTKRYNNYPSLRKNDIGILSDITVLEINNTIKKFEITTEVEGNVGGTISGNGMTPYESVRYTENSTLPIVMTPDNGYAITKITINGVPLNFKIEEGQQSYQLPQFENVLENKHVVVTYIEEDQLIRIKKVDEDNSQLKLEGAKFKVEELETRVVTDELDTTWHNRDVFYDIPNIGEEVLDIVSGPEQTTYSSYYFEQENDNYYIPNNTNVSYSDAVSCYTIDLENLSGQYYMSFDWLVSSRDSSNYAWATITESNTNTLSNLQSSNNRYFYKYGNNNGSDIHTSYYNKPLEGGKKYYIYIGYRKGYKNTSDTDRIVFGNVKVYNVSFTQQSFGYDLIDGQYISNNQGKDNTTAEAYMVLDLRNTYGNYNVIVNAESSCGSGDYGYIGLNETRDSMASQNYLSGIRSARDYSMIAKGGKLYYIHFAYIKDKDGSDGEDCIKINSVRLEVNTNKEYLNTEVVTGAGGEVTVKAAPGIYKITEIEAPTGYRLDSTEHIVDASAGSGATLTVTNKTQPKVIVHHYLLGTENKVAKDEMYTDDVGKEYATHPHTDLMELELQKDSNNQYIIPNNASGNYTEDTIEVIYYYEAKPINLTIKHYKVGTETELAPAEKKETPAVVTFEGEQYSVTAEDNYDLDTNTNYISLLNDYELVDIESTIKENATIDEILTYNTDSEIIYYYSLKKHTITTEVETHTEENEDILTGEVKNEEITGGSITGEYNIDYLETNKIRFVEESEQNGNSTINIVATPDDGYEVSTIELVSTDDNNNDTRTLVYGENAASNAEITATLNEDKSVTLSTFENVVADKHVVVKFERSSTYEYIVNYLDINTNEKIHESKVQGDMEYGDIVLSTTEKININGYEYHSVDKQFIMIETDSTRNIINIYYQKKPFIIEESQISKNCNLSAITDRTTQVPYVISYNATIKDYIGDVEVEITDTLEYKIDDANSNLNGGTYNDTNKTIKWTVTVPNINTYNNENNEQVINITKTISLLYKDVDEMDDVITNNVKGVLRIENTTRESEDEAETEISLPGHLVVRYVDKYTDEEIADSTLKDGALGSSFNTDDYKKAIANYTLVEEPDPKTGVYTKGTITKTYYYAMNASLRVQHIDKLTNQKLVDDEVTNGKENDDYTTSSKTIEHYKVSQADLPTNATGKLTVVRNSNGTYTTETVVKYYYIHDAKVIENHIDIIDNRVLATETHNGYEGDSYNIPSRTIDGYTLVETYNNENKIPANKSGNMTRSDITVNYYYIRPAKVIVQHIDKATNEKIADDETINGVQNQAYTTSSKNVENYVLVETPDNKNGSMTVTVDGDGTVHDTTTVTYIYSHVSAGVIEKHIDIETGAILYNEVHDGNEGDAYKIDPKEYDESDETTINFKGYELVETDRDSVNRLPDNAEGTMTIEPITVTYYYRRPAKVRVQYIDKLTGETLTDDVIINGYQNDPYTTSSKTFENYKLDEDVLPTNAEGQMLVTVDDQGNVVDETIVKYYYIHDAKVVEKHIDITNNNTIYSEEHNGYEGDSYDIDAREYDKENNLNKEFESYDLVTELEDGTNKLPTNSEGSMTRETIEVIYYYIKKSAVKVNYYDINSNEKIANEEIINGHEGDQYETEDKDIENYKIVLKDKDGNVKYPTNAMGTMTSEIIEVNYYYNKKTSVTTRYYDIVSGEEIAEQNKKDGLQGDAYTTEEKEIDKYDIVKENYPENAKGNMGAEPIFVDYYYIRKMKVIVHYKDRDTGEEVSEDIIIDGHEGDVYHTKGLDIEGYELVKVPTDKDGTMGYVTVNGEKRDYKEVTYYYAMIIDKPIFPQTGENSDKFIVLALIGLGFMVMVVSKKLYDRNQKKIELYNEQIKKENSNK